MSVAGATKNVMMYMPVNFKLRTIPREREREKKKYIHALLTLKNVWLTAA